MFFCVIENARNVGRTELLMAKSAATKTNVAKKLCQSQYRKKVAIRMVVSPTGAVSQDEEG